MANPAGHVVLGEEEAQQAVECYATMEAELQALRQRNEELTRAVQEQQEVVATERCGWIVAQELRRRILRI